ncbi:hypothetical protein WR25_07183 isoform B [Diploscapter pachys]|uniref:RRM domain-containing protein n=1 Tax=Diploscapter pachys TaxID=2018661 RepID=A0A2A2LMX8_9BILA|nr:hypothetical protein WR25_07183 isoform B [Diploscapter pachys]
MAPAPVPLSWLDYAVFTFSILLSIGTGVYHAIKAHFFLKGDHGKTTAKDEYLMGGAQIWLNFAIGAVSSLVTCFVFLPVFHKMKSTCLHEYFIHRYNSVLIRRMFSFLFLAFTLIYLSIVIYAPSVALSPVLGINKWWLILIFGGSTTLYTCIGGLKAVVWTDSLQYNSLWINIFSGTIVWLASFGVNQLAIQRYASLPTMKQAKNIILYTCVPFIILCSIVAFVGFIALAYFYNCNPIETGEINEIDHITILFARDILHPTPGLFGLYVSCIMSATLSTLSSGMNSSAAAIYEDFLKQSLDGKITDTAATRLNKLIVIACGVVSTILAFAAESLGGILRMCIAVMGAISGPMVAIFVLAMFFPRTGKWSCLISFVLSNLIMVIICVVNYVEDPFKELFLSTNTTEFGCGAEKPFTIKQQPSYDAHFGNPETMYISRISTYAYAGIGFILMMAIALVVSLFEKPGDATKIHHLTFAGRHSFRIFREFCTKMSSFSTGDNPFIATASIHSAPVISSNGFDLSALLPQFLSLQKIASSRELERKEENSQPSQSLTQIVGPLYMRKLFIGGLSHETDDEDLRRYFARWGHVLDAIVIRDAATRHSRGFGFITYASQEFAEKCLACKPHTVKGKTVDSKRAVPRELIGKVEAQNCVDEDVIYQNNRKVLLTGLQKAHTVLALREYFTSFGLLNQVSSKNFIKYSKHLINMYKRMFVCI